MAFLDQLTFVAEVACEAKVSYCQQDYDDCTNTFWWIHCINVRFPANVFLQEIRFQGLD